ncbi:MAG: hypothetical protein CVU34_07165 [Betaproteobacteria bacterium HGW-Betaproteobacteria-7]|jgi:hypothetical protein|nr:MAG: hypothetical protein CVU34_07165 [Betaproteobacteria bacterium HGW-Betaproteobacteria-7]
MIAPSLSDGIAIAYGLIALVVIGLAFKLPKTKAMRALATLVAVVAFAYLPLLGIYEYKTEEEPLQKRWKETEEIFAEKCRTQAGIKIYRTVPEVEGIMLLKVRPPRTEAQLRDRMWPGAAFVNDHDGDDYIKSFLGYEYRAVDKDGVVSSRRGYINVEKRSGGLPGYRWVEVVDPEDGKRYRYSSRYDEPWKIDSSYSKSYVRFTLDKTLSPSTTPPRYGVTYEDHVIPTDRERWIASGTVKVIDLTTQEVLGEMTKFKLSTGGVSPWLRGPECPIFGDSSGADTRLFVDQILIPKGEN